MIECKPNTEYATQHNITGFWCDKNMQPISPVYCTQMPTLSYRIHSPKDAHYLKVIKGETK